VALALDGMPTGDIHLEGKVRIRNKQNLKKSQHLNCDVSQCGCLSAEAFGHFGTAAERMVSVNTTSAPSATCLCRLPQPPPPRIPRLGIDRQCTHSLHRNDMTYCHFELCRDCGLGCFNDLLLADIRRLSMVAVMFMYQITVFLQQNTTASLLELYFTGSMQTVYARGGGWGSRQRQVADGPMGPM